MEDTYKFPGGYDVKVVRKQDIIDCIDSNIIDKDVALAIVKQCEVDAANFLRQGRWTGLPFMGSLRPSPVVKLEKTKEQQELIEAAFEDSTKSQYVIFRKNLAHDNAKKLAAQKKYNYILSMSVSKDRPGFKRLVKEKGEHYARFRYYLKKCIVAVDNEFINFENGEEIVDR